MKHEKEHNISKRIGELRLLAQENDLNLATRRLMDFVSDMDLEFTKIVNQVMALRADYNYSQLLENDRKREQEEVITIRLLELIGVIELEIIDQSTGVKEPNYQLITSNNLKEKYRQLDKLPQNIDVFKGEGIIKTYRSFPFTLYNIDLTLRAGEITGIVGENGNGKTTLLRIVAGELSTDSGYLSYPTIDAKPNDWYTIKHHIAFIPQRLPKWKGLLKDNLHFSAANHGIFGVENEKYVSFIIHRLGLSRYENARWQDISSGYRLRFELAKALVWKPKLLILDEPLANLDINAKLLFMQDLRLLSSSIRHPIAIVMSSQQLHEIENVVDNIMFLKEGKCVYSGSVDSFGNDRQSNTFEVSGNFEREELYQIMQKLTSDFRIEDTGQSLVVDVSKQIESREIIQHLTTYKQLDYFRDISRSTRKLF